MTITRRILHWSKNYAQQANFKVFLYCNSFVKNCIVVFNHFLRVKKLAILRSFTKTVMLCCVECLWIYLLCYSGENLIGLSDCIKYTYYSIECLKCWKSENIIILNSFYMIYCCLFSTHLTNHQLDCAWNKF